MLAVENRRRPSCRRLLLSDEKQQQQQQQFRLEARRMWTMIYAVNNGCFFFNCRRFFQRQQTFLVIALRVFWRHLPRKTPKRSVLYVTLKCLVFFIVLSNIWSFFMTSYPIRCVVVPAVQTVMDPEVIFSVSISYCSASVIGDVQAYPRCFHFPKRKSNYNF